MRQVAVLARAAIRREDQLPETANWRNGDKTRMRLATVLRRQNSEPFRLKGCLDVYLGSDLVVHVGVELGSNRD